MENKSYAYAVANVRSKEMSLLSVGFMEQLADASDMNEVNRMLADGNATDFDNSMVNTWEYLCEITPDIKALQFLIVKNDFHNLKAIIKGIVLGIDGVKYCVRPCIINPDELFEKLYKKDFKSLPLWISDTAVNSYELLTSTMDGQLFDMFVDKASLSTMKEFAKLSDSYFAERIAELFVALTNIKIALRIAGTKNSATLLDNAFCECDTIDTEELRIAVSNSKDDVLEYLRNTDYEPLCEHIMSSMTDFERACDNMITELLDSSRTISLGPEPLISYYLAKEMEWKMLRITVNGKKIGLAGETIRERMRELYV